MLGNLLEHVLHESEFKVMCDGLLRLEVGPTLQTYGAAGRDGGIDASFQGAYQGSSGLWVFQYKFADVRSGVQAARGRVLAKFKKTKRTKSEFEKVVDRKPDYYVLITNVPLTVGNVDDLKAWASVLVPGATFVAWDTAAIAPMLRGRQHLLISVRDQKHHRATEHVVHPAWRFITGAYQASTAWQESPMWPLDLRWVESKHPLDELGRPFEWRSKWQLQAISSLRENTLIANQSPLYEYAKLAWPHAMSEYENTVAQINILLKVICDHVLMFSRAMFSADGPLHGLVARSGIPVRNEAASCRARQTL